MIDRKLIRLWLKILCSILFFGINAKIIIGMIKKIFTIVLAIFYYHSAHSVLEIDVNQGKIEPIPIAVSIFETRTAEEKDVAISLLDVILNDLEGSGLFRAINSSSFLEKVTLDKQLNYASWRKINAATVVGGSVNILPNGQLRVKFKMWNPYNEVLVDGVEYKVDLKSWRRLSHKIADRVYQKMTGEGPYFDTRILFVSRSGFGKRIKKRLAIMDQDGANLKFLTDDSNIVTTPRFDPNSQKAIYMAFQKNKVARVYVLDIERGLQKAVGNFSGISFAPRFSPDGNSAILSIAKNGSTNIFEINLINNSVVRLTHDLGAINTSPSYSPDNSKIAFNSDRAGSRQLYIMNRNGSNVERISMGGGSYATPVWSPRGDLIAFTKIYEGNFYIGVMRPDGSDERLLTRGWLVEGPTWSPNGRVLMFTRQNRNGATKIHSINVNGYNEKVIRTSTDASDPAWSPMLK